MGRDKDKMRDNEKEREEEKAREKEKEREKEKDKDREKDSSVPQRRAQLHCGNSGFLVGGTAASAGDTQASCSLELVQKEIEVILAGPAPPLPAAKARLAYLLGVEEHLGQQRAEPSDHDE